jgi:hypothetical protein
LKQFVDKSLELKGNWTSPGGDIKLFNTANSEFNIKWYGHSKKLIILADNEQYLKRKLSCLVNTFECDEATNVSNSSSVSKAKVCEHTDNCINRLRYNRSVGRSETRLKDFRISIIYFDISARI